MDALLSTFVAAALAEWGDKTQLLVIALAARYRRPVPILAGVAVAALANALLAAFGGTLLTAIITPQAIALLVAVAFAYAGIAGFIGQKDPEMGRGWRTGPFVTTAFCFFLLEFGDKTQFVTATLAAHFDALWLAAAGATAGVVALSAPSAVLADALASRVPMRAIRIGIAILFLVTAFIIAVSALRLT